MEDCAVSSPGRSGFSFFSAAFGQWSPWAAWALGSDATPEEGSAWPGLLPGVLRPRTGPKGSPAWALLSPVWLGSSVQQEWRSPRTGQGGRAPQPSTHTHPVSPRRWTLLALRT